VAVSDSERPGGSAKQGTSLKDLTEIPLGG